MTSPEGIDALRAAGWHPGRRVAVTREIDALKSDGHEVWPELITFLSEYSHLRYEYVRNGGRDSIWLDAEAACEYADPGSVRLKEAELGARLAPIGYAYSEHLMLVAASDGRYLGLYDDFVAMLGTSPEAMIQALIREDVEILSQ